MSVLPVETARVHRDAARKHRARAAGLAGVPLYREWMLARQRVLAVRELRRRFPRGAR